MSGVALRSLINDELAHSRNTNIDTLTDGLLYYTTLDY